MHFQGDDLSVPTLLYSECVEPLPPPTQVDLCAQWLLSYLSDAGQPLKPATVVRAASGQGFPRATLYRARYVLAGRIIDLGNSTHDPQKRWTIAPLPPDRDAPA